MASSGAPDVKTGTAQSTEPEHHGDGILYCNHQNTLTHSSSYNVQFMMAIAIITPHPIGLEHINDDTESCDGSRQLIPMTI